MLIVSFTFPIIGLFSSLALITLVASIISFRENEYGAGYKLLYLVVILGVFAVLAGLPDYPYKGIVALLLYIPLPLLGVIALRKPISGVPATNTTPKREVDELDTMFARMALERDSPDWRNYYSDKPEKLESDERSRSLPGLLSPESIYYKPLLFSSADANFSIIDYLHGANSMPVSECVADIDASTLTAYLKEWAYKLGVHSIGITPVKDYHFYTRRGRGEGKGKEVTIRHANAIAFTVEMDFRNVQSAPMGPMVLESSGRYLQAATLALQLAGLLKNLGFDSRAHIDGDYEVICPLVARDAGLGEIGRMGLLMTPRLGPRVRIAVVTTDAPLVPDEPYHDPTAVEFCRFCKKCADCCPGRSIPFDDRKLINGVLRWKIDSESCFQYWCNAGTDCGRCMSVCPFSHPDNILHAAVRFFIRRSFFIARLAYLADDLLYGRKPKPKPVPKWMG